MAELLGVNYTKGFSAEPATKANANDIGGVKRELYDSYTFAAILAIGDTVLLGKLPKGAKLTGAKLIVPVDSGAIGIIKVGWEAGANGDEVADDDGMFAVAEGDFGAGALNNNMLISANGFQKTFSEEVKIVVECTQASTGDADKLELIVEYVLN